MLISDRWVFLPWSRSNGPTSRTAVYGPVRTVVWQGSAGNRCPYADRQSPPQALRCCPNRPTEKSNLDRCISSAVPVRQAPTASRDRRGRWGGTEFGNGVITHALKP